jgi:hypothetical protein
MDTVCTFLENQVGGRSSRPIPTGEGMARKVKSQAQVLVPDGAGGLVAGQDRRFDKGAWPIEVPVPAEHSDRWLKLLAVECLARNWQYHNLAQLDRGENSGSVTVRTAPGEHSPELVIRWVRRPDKPLVVRARLAGSPTLSRDVADGFIAAVQERCRTQAKQRIYCWGQLHYDGLPWRGEIWLDDNLRLGPPSRDGRMVVNGVTALHGPQAILVDALIEATDAQEAASAIFVLLRELAVFLSVVMRIAVHVPPSCSPRAWTWIADADGRVECDVRWLGYCETNRTQQMPPKGATPPVPLKPVRRPDLSLHGLGEMGESERWLPEDVVDLWKQVSGLPAERRQQFMQAGNLWRLALVFAGESQTDSHAKMVVACEALKPPGQEFDHHNVYDVVEVLLGKQVADVLRETGCRPQDTRNAYFHRGEFRGDEFALAEPFSTYSDPSFTQACLMFRQIPPAAILEWLRRGGNLPALPAKRLDWRKKGRKSLMSVILLVGGGAVCLALGWLLRAWFAG